jgi:hypothetical protein
MRQLILYSTAHCSLCEQALDLLLSLPDLAGTQLNVVDIADDDELMAQYGERIPVLRLDDRELNAPFDGPMVARFIGR